MLEELVSRLTQSPKIQCPPDGCPECLTRHNYPQRSAPTEDRQGITGYYRCGKCGHRWTCNWLVSAL